MPTYAITGIQDGLDDDTNPLRQVPLRLEIDDWCKRTDDVYKNQRALFFLAFNNLCRMDPKEKLSYFQIAGIHGQPFVPWDEDIKPKLEKSGYCTHNSILFTTWHRPYMLLFEQVLYRLMKDVANSFSESERPAMLEALQSWRFPFWDWASKKPDRNGDYNLPVVLPYRGVEIKVPASFKDPEQPPSTFDEGAVWSDPSPAVPFEHRQAVINPLFQFTMPGTYENMGDVSKLGKLGISGIEGTFENSLKKYIIPFNRCKATTRHAKLGPDSNVEQYWIGGVQQNDSIVQGLRNKEEFKDIKLEGHLRATLSDAFYRVAIIPKFEDFGTKRVEGNNKHVFESAENLHDFIHGVCGGNSEITQREEEGRTVVLQGHMSRVPVAAFDPIFWLHHCNVDRMVAIWEVLHRDTPNNWFDGKNERDKDPGNWAIKPDHADLPSDELHPFHKNEKGDYWTSNDVRETAPLGYSYPELEKWKHVDTEGKYNLKKHQKELIKYLNSQYNSAAKAAVKADLTADPHDADTSKPTLHQLHHQAGFNPAPRDDIIGYPDYVANIVYDRFALGGHPYTISIFIGQVPVTVPYTFSDPEGSLVGQVYTLSSPADQLGTDPDVGCVNCRSQEASRVLSSGSVALTNPLITRWKNALVHTPRRRFASDPGVEAPIVLSSMHPEDVVPFLKTNLRWRVTSMTGDLVPVESLQSLMVSVAVGKADHFADRTKLSRFYDYKGAFDVTSGRPQGAGPEDGMYPPR